MNVLMQSEDCEYMKYDQNCRKNYNRMNVLEDSQSVVYSNIFDQINTNFNRCNSDQIQTQIGIYRNQNRDQNLDDLILNDENVFKTDVKQNQNIVNKENNGLKIDWVFIIDYGRNRMIKRMI